MSIRKIDGVLIDADTVDGIDIPPTAGVLSFSGTSPISGATSASLYLYGCGSKAKEDMPGTAAYDCRVLAPRSGTVKNLYVRSEDPLDTGEPMSYTVQKDISDQALTCTIASEGLEANDSVNSFSINAGQWLSLKQFSVTTQTSPHAIQASFELV